MQKDETKQLHKTTKAKQYAVKQPMAYWYSQREGKKYLEIKWKHDEPKLMGYIKRVLTGKFIAIQEKYQISNQMLHLKQRKNKQNPKVVEGKRS